MGALPSLPVIQFLMPLVPASSACNSRERDDVAIALMASSCQGIHPGVVTSFSLCHVLLLHHHLVMHGTWQTDFDCTPAGVGTCGV